MFIEGLKLMVIGMSTVMAFLSLMFFFISLTSKLTKNITARELEVINEAKRQRALKTSGKKDDKLPMAVIAAAVTAYEADKQKVF